MAANKPPPRRAASIAASGLLHPVQPLALVLRKDSMANFWEIVEMKAQIVCGFQLLNLAISVATMPSIRLCSSITALLFDPFRSYGFRCLEAGLACLAPVRLLAPRYRGQLTLSLMRKS